MDRFWSKVDIKGPDECWEWTAYINPKGYGRFGVEGGMMLAHRASWTLTNGPIPDGAGYHGTCVLHKCDNRRCCNPSHLFLGTIADNNADMVAKGRESYCNPNPGEANGRAKLTETDARYIKFENIENCAEVARHYKVDPGTIRKIRRGDAWKHVKEALG